MSGFNNRPTVGRQALDNAASNTSGVLSTRPSAKYASGARTTLKINNTIIGFAFAVSWRITTQHLEINTIDNVEAEELAPQRISVEGTISALHIPGTSATTEQWQGSVLSFLFNKYITIEVRDSESDQLLFYTGKAVITSRQEDIRIDDLANVSLSFKAIGWKDEMEPKRPESSKPPESPKESLSSQIIINGVDYVKKKLPIA